MHKFAKKPYRFHHLKIGKFLRNQSSHKTFHLSIIENLVGLNINECHIFFGISSEGIIM